MGNRIDRLLREELEDYQKKTRYVRDDFDRFYTPRPLWRAFISQVGEHYPLPHLVIDPCAGDGRMADTIQEEWNGYVPTQEGDAEPRNERIEKKDFFGWNIVVPNGDRVWLMTNPPYKGLEVKDFLRFALRSRLSNVALLLRLTAIEWVTEPIEGLIPDMIFITRQRPTWEGPGGVALLEQERRRRPGAKRPPSDTCGSALVVWSIGCREASESGTIIRNIGKWR